MGDIDGLKIASEELLIEAERALFEEDAASYGFDLERQPSTTAEPWDEYKDEKTGYRWGGWLAARFTM
jgi:hypothetical protein